MNGVHDCGGMHGLGPIDPEPNEPVFKEDWQRHMFGMFIAMLPAGLFNLDQVRHAIERMGGAAYLNTSYYEHWLAALETLLIEGGHITREELEARKAELAKEAA